MPVEEKIPPACQRYIRCESGLPLKTRCVLREISRRLEQVKHVVYADFECASLPAVFAEGRDPTADESHRFQMTLERIDVDIRPDPVGAVATALRVIANSFHNTADALEVDRQQIEDAAQTEADRTARRARR